MSVANTVERRLDERRSSSAILVLGMHRSGTSAITGALGLCGAWVGEETELTGANAENPRGFWERRDMRRICDRLLQAAGADWWKVASFDPKAIPHAILAEERRRFEKIIAALAEHGTWVVKEPRLCLLLPLLRDHIDNPVCIHIFRNPLEVARSLQSRNGFSIAAGLALWEAYNRRALSASKNLPRLLVSNESLMLRPVETTNGLVRRLEELAVSNLVRPTEDRIKQFINPSLYRRRATEEETDEFLAPSQRTLWQQIRSDQVFVHDGCASISRVIKQHLFDLESAERSLSHHKDRTNELNAELRKRTATIEARDATIEARDETNRALKSRTNELNAELRKRTATIEARDATIEARDETNRALKSRTDELNAELRKRTATIEARDATIRGLFGSTSWRVTAPLRALSPSVKWSRRNLRRALRLLFWIGTGQFSRAIGAVRFVIRGSYKKLQPPRGIQQRTVADSLSKLSQEQAETSSRQIRPTVPARPVGDKPKPKVSVIAWDLGHNPLGRAYLLADVLRNDYDVELIGANFPRFGNEIWEPLRSGSRVKIKSFPGGNFPGHFKRMEDIAEQIEGDVLCVSKPRLPSLELAILAKLHRNRTIILDIDDYELGFFKNREPLTLEATKASGRTLDFDCPHDEIWTRYSESLISLFEGITVSNEELRKKFGGIILPHMRDEADFEPAAYPRDGIRARLGFTPEDKVVLFAGTPRMHKGFARIAAALKKLNRGNYKLLIVGSPADSESRHFINNIDPDQVKIVSNIPFFSLPDYLRAGDLICLLQDEREVTSHFQVPAKFTDGLSMCIPMLATNVPPLVNLANERLVDLLDDTPLDQKIDSIFKNYETHKHLATRNRDVFLAKYSYGANLPAFKNLIDRLVHNPAPIPDAFRELVAYHREIFFGAADLPRVTAKVVTQGLSTGRHAAVDAEKPRRSPVVRARGKRLYVDDKMDIVFFWKQNDTGIYGRRQDMLVKYLARDPKIQRIFHFDAPISILKSGGAVVESGQGGRYSHARLVFYQTLRRKLHLKNTGKVRFDTFIFGTKRRVPGFMKWMLASERDYLDYLDRFLTRHNIGQRRTIFWVCPNDFYFPSIEHRFNPDLVVADIIDDQRRWNISSEYREQLRRNYEEVLVRTDLAFANCQSVFESMGEFASNLHMLPNAAELVERESRHWKKPAELRRIKGPLIGYVGNLDVARLDVDLLMAVARARPDWNLVFIGSMHMGKEIKILNKFRNVHFLGVRVYDDALRYIRHFDVAMIPHLDNDLTRNMNPLKLYVYFALHVPVVTTPIANIGDFGEITQVANTADEFIERIGYCLHKNPVSENLTRVRDLLKANSWEERVKSVLECIEAEFDRRTAAVSAIAPVSAPDQENGYRGRCTVCGHTGQLRHEETIGSFRENYRCAVCKASLRYREQARVMLDRFSQEGSEHLAELVNEPEFRDLKIYEPGLTSPFRELLQRLSGYHASYFWNDVEPGEFRRGIQCQDLMNLTYEDDFFDLVLSSDVFAHVRKPFGGFREVNRVLKPGGFHIFSVPVQHPMPSETIFRVDTSGPEDVFTLPAQFNSATGGENSLVYTDFGADMVKIMAAGGIDLKTESSRPIGRATTIAERMLSFYWRKADTPQDTNGQVCNICGSNQFSEGPFGRRSRTGKLPACVSCGSLERHRLIRHVWACIPVEDLHWKGALQFSMDPSVDGEWFCSFETSIYGHRNSLDLQKLERADGIYDIVICNHILEHVENDRQAFREIFRILKSDGFLQFTVPGPTHHAETDDLGYPKPHQHNHYRIYGRDLFERFGDAVPGVRILEVGATDEVTGTSDFVYFAFVDDRWMNSMRIWFKEFKLRNND